MPLPTKLILASIFSVLFASTAPAATYSNVKYGYSVSYPDDLLKALPEPDAADGITLLARSGSGASIRVWGEYNLLPQSPEKIAQDAEQDCPSRKASYRVARAEMVAVSCASSATVFYRKTLILGDRAVTFYAKYPVFEQKPWNAIIAQLSKSLVLSPRN